MRTPTGRLLTLDELRHAREFWVWMARGTSPGELRTAAAATACKYHRELIAAKRQLRTLRRFSHFTDEGIAVHE